VRRFAPELAGHLAGGLTTLCACWRVVRADGVALGFTDHDRALAFDGLVFSPETGLTASEAVARTGLAVDGLEVEGALVSDRLGEDDLRAGLYDNARVETWLVNWADPDQRHLMRVGSIGEVRRQDSAFVAEIRGLAHALDGEQGRMFRFTCDADLGNARCRVDLGDPRRRATGTVAATDGRRVLRSPDLAGRAEGTFDRGLVAFAGGANAGLRMEVGRHRAEAGAGVLELWRPMPRDISPGDAFAVTAGCDRRFSTCRDRFDNAVNFRGFPHMPGNDFALSYARRGERNDGTPVA
jgi:uncharacterized phage protein (TIGR02218 family)